MRRSNKYGKLKDYLPKRNAILNKITSYLCSKALTDGLKRIYYKK